MMATVEREPTAGNRPEGDDLRAFLLVLRQGLLLIVGYIERRYGIEPRYRRHSSEVDT